MLALMVLAAVLAYTPNFPRCLLFVEVCPFSPSI